MGKCFMSMPVVMQKVSQGISRLFNVSSKHLVFFLPKCTGRVFMLAFLSPGISITSKSTVFIKI